MPRKILIDRGKLMKMIKENGGIIKKERDSIVKGHPARERFSAMLTPYDVVLDYLKKCQRYNSSGKKI